MPKPIDQMTLDELRAAEKEAWAALKAAEAINKPIHDCWIELHRAKAAAESREKVLTEIRANWKGPGACPV